MFAKAGCEILGPSPVTRIPETAAGYYLSYAGTWLKPSLPPAKTLVQGGEVTHKKDPPEYSGGSLLLLGDAIMVLNSEIS